ncbi:GNAT family N-acetyltransferase, partial [Burkholderia pseudomallei]
CAPVADVDMGDTIGDITVGRYDDPNVGPGFRDSVPPADGVSAPCVVYGLPPFITVLARAVVARSPVARPARPEPVVAG